MVAAAIVGAAVVGGGASIAASNKASKTARDNAASSNALQTNMYNQNKDTLQPFVDSGTKATSSINALLGQGGDTAAANAAFDAYKGSTEYTSRFNEGQRAVTAALGGKGLLDSGAAQRAILKYGQTFASNEFGNYLGNLQTQQQTGLGAASALAGNGQNYANAVSYNNGQAANTAANSALATGSAINGVLGSALSAYGLSQGVGSSYGGTGTLSKSAFEANRPTFALPSPVLKGF
ncbi:hypothetical protein D9601_19395 [Sphingomonas sp. MA1305]|uniref:hypothetical protein n=1 Tax=Sphingomonas sp. MA1305 TaxID=2479204 RepID=UPI0018DFA8F5|nr:hypothetical protein [Sphingomonas sp. MA1305]MBI0477504.1 hypothetical protein [Sphingomonas sp. MA1305]